MYEEELALSDEALLATERRGDVVIITVLAERIIMFTAPEIREAILEAIKDKPLNVIINLGRVKYFDSSGIAVIFKVTHFMKEYNGNLRLTGVNKSLLKVLHNTTGYDDSIYFDNLEEALKDL